MTVSIDKYGELSMKLSDWDDIRKWMDANPEIMDMAFNEALRLYVEQLEGEKPK